MVKNKFSAGVFKKKLFGGGTQTNIALPFFGGGNGGVSARSSTSGFPNELLNRSIASPFGIMNTTLEMHHADHDKFNSSLMYGTQKACLRLASDSEI